MAESSHRVQPRSSKSLPAGKFRRLIDAVGDPSSFEFLRLPHGVLMKPADAAKYRFKKQKVEDGGAITKLIRPAEEISDNEAGVVKDTLVRFRALCVELSNGAVKRVDVEAANRMKTSPGFIEHGDLIGSVPGVDVGDHFRYRTEISINGLHRPRLAEVHFIKHGEYDLCTSVVASGYGGYDKSTHITDSVIVTIGGGPVHRELQGGNLALSENSLLVKNAVRVIRGNREAGHGGSVNRTYIYDGLYEFDSFWLQKVESGKMVYKFKLVRRPGQPNLSNDQWAKLRMY